MSGGDRNKDMGGLLQEDASTGDSAALRGNMALQKPLKVTRHVYGETAKQYVYCGLYEVVEWWPALEIDEKKKHLRKLTQPEPDSADRSFVVADSSEVTYFKLLRLPGQQPVPPVQMAFKSERYGTESDYHKMSVAERSFKSTREHYGTYRAAGTTGPVERFAHNKPCGQEDGVFEADLCDRCGIDGNALDGMHRCWSCWERGTEVVSHLSCIDSHELVWLLGDEEDRHWRCRQCRQKDLRPASGLVYEDVAADLTAQPAIEAAQAATPPSAPSAANTASRQLPATASSSRSKRTRRQTDFYHNIYAASPGAESSDDSNDSNYSAAHSKRKQQRNVRQTRSSSSKYGQRTRAAGELRPTFSNECTDSIPEHPVLSADSQGASASRHPASASQQAASRQAVQDWPDDASSDGGRKQAVCDSSNNCVVPSPVIRHVTAEQAVFGDSSQDDQPAAPCGSLSTAYDTDGDSDGDDVPAFAAPLPLLPRPTSTGCNQQKPKTEIRRSHKQLRGTAEPAVLPPSTEAAAAAAVAPVKVPLALGSATLLDVAEPANLVRRPGQPSGNSLTSASQRVFSASTPPPRTVEELVAAANANMGDSKDAITLVQMRVFSRLEHLLDLEKDEEHDPLDELQDSAELTSYQARKIRKHYLRIEQLHK